MASHTPTGNQQQKLLRIENLCVSYGDIQVLWGVSFDVPSKGIVSLIGSNGAGKTTTLKTIAGLLTPSTGSITFDGKSLVRMGTEKIVGSGVVYVPEGRGIFPDMTVKENLEMGSYPKHARKKRSDTIEKVYSLFQVLKQRRGQLAGTLSGGESQMLAIARGMMSLPKILMLDEPSAGVAPIVVDKIFDAIRRLREEDGLTILIVEQDAGRALRTSDLGYVLESGRMKLSGSGEELLNNQYVKEAYLGM